MTDASLPTVQSGDAATTWRTDLSWVNALTLWPQPAKNSLLRSLDEAETRALLDPLVYYPRLEHGVEDLLAVFSAIRPEVVIEFLGQRLG